MRPPPPVTRLLAGLCLMLSGCLAADAGEGRCEDVLSGTGRLAVVTADGMNRIAGRLRLYRRDDPQGAWTPVSPGEPAVLGRTGMAWGFPFREAARGGEPVKVEGDGRTPAGFYRTGRNFGFPATARAGHLVLRPGRTICVDDPASPAYNTLVSVVDGAATPRGEDMGTEPLYRRGLVIDYPSSRGAKAGSCIFLHVWRGPGQGTVGCVALPEPRVAALQDFFAQGGAIAILPETALDRFKSCLPRAE